MVSSDTRHTIWVERYRPKTVSECILPEALRNEALGFVKQGHFPNMLFTGTAGIGKTTLAKAMCNEIGADLLIINASSENGIDTIRTKIAQFASTVSFSDSKKVTLLDEADYLTAQAQAALRNFIEEFAGNHSMILTCNFKNKIIEPLHSRSAVFDFKIPTSERAELMAAFFKRTTEILSNEGVEFDKKVVAEVVKKHFPDFRRCLNELQRYSAAGKIDSGILLNFSTEAFSSLMKSLKDKKYGEVRKWVAQNSDMDTSMLFRSFYDLATEKMMPKSLPSLVLILADYQYKAAFVADQEINTMAALTEVMLNQGIEWK
jgi:DNA polymerase III delta prime subunit